MYLIKKLAILKLKVGPISANLGIFYYRPYTALMFDMMIKILIYFIALNIMVDLFGVDTRHVK